jgi:hypothetical protein
MIERYFSAPKTTRRLRAGLSGPFIDGFAEALQQQGYSHSMAVCSLHAASHIGWFVQRRGGVLSDMNEATMEAFGRHLLRCRCYQLHNRRKTGYHARFGVKRFHRYLIKLGICVDNPATNNPAAEPLLVAAFRDWLFRPVECPGCSSVSTGSFQPVWCGYNTEADHFAASFLAFPKLPRLHQNRSPPRHSGNSSLAVGVTAPMPLVRRSRSRYRRL